MDPLKMYFLLNMVIFHCYVSLLEGKMYMGLIIKGPSFQEYHHFPCEASLFGLNSS